MKVRWTNHSVRLRITPQELALLKNGNVVSESLGLSLLNATQSWKVRIESAHNTSLAMHDGVLVFALSSHDVAQLVEPEREGVYFSQDGARFYIEKDFPCAHPRASEAEETSTETFAPPRGFEERKN